VTETSSLTSNTLFENEIELEKKYNEQVDEPNLDVERTIALSQANIEGTMHNNSHERVEQIIETRKVTIDALNELCLDVVSNSDSQEVLKIDYSQLARNEKPLAVFNANLYYSML